MGKRILLPLDGSRRADAVLAHLPAVCEPGDEVMLLSVARPGSRQQVGTRPTRAVTSWANSAGAVRLVTGGDTPVFETKEQARERQVVTLTSYLNAYADEVQARGYSVHIQPLIDKDPAGAIIEFAQTYRPDLILMARRTLDPRRLFGSVSRRVQ